MRSSLCVGASVAFVMSGAAFAGNYIAAHSFTAQGQGASAGFELQGVFGLSDLGDPNATGYLSSGTLDLADFINGAFRTLSGDFSAAASELTNGVDSPAFFGLILPGAVLVQENLPESAAFGGQAGVIGPDLTGYVLSSVRLFGTSIQFNGDDSFEVTVEFQFYGTRVPAPGGAAVASLAVMGALRRRR